MGGRVYTVTASLAALLDDPANGAKIGSRDSQLLFGETFNVEKTEGEWAYGTSVVDGYKGYVRAAHLEPLKNTATHFVALRWSHVYPEPGFKTRPGLYLGMMSRLFVDEKNKKDGFVSVPGYGWVHEDHIAPLSSLGPSNDHVETALLFLGCPYLYGGRSAQGLDCSALVQLSLIRSGVPCPRDSDQQTAIGKPVEKDETARGDLVFFKGHVGIMLDDKSILNATARTMDVRIENLDSLEKIYAGITAIRRIR
ncbi:MAG TPA: peptidoglycan endopeptidase [Rhodospirillaceae bacterium]|nr:peptidoglycan endopeptidase [Rhodospirillaceae bacterium]